MLSRRIITAVVGIIMAVYIIRYGQWLFSGTVAVLGGLAWFEYSKMLKNVGIRVADGLGAVGILILFGCAQLGNTYEFQMIITLLIFILSFLAVVNKERYSIMDVTFTLFGVLYIGLLFSYLILLRFTANLSNFVTPVGEFSAGEAYIWLAFISTWVSDTAAYGVGTLFGQHKLCPRVSPGKTVEGAIGGLLACTGVTGLFGGWVNIPLPNAIIVGLFIGGAAQLGDLTESLLKRFAGVKDSGNILPGHGGVLDRFDSIIFVIPVIYYYIQSFFLID